MNSIIGPIQLVSVLEYLHMELCQTRLSFVWSGADHTPPGASNLTTRRLRPQRSTLTPPDLNPPLNPRHPNNRTLRLIFSSSRPASLS